MTTILIAVDGSKESLEAVRQGMYLVQNGLRADLALLNVQEPASFLELVTRDADAIAAAAVEAGEHLMQAGMQLLDHAQVPYTTAVVLGEPGVVIVDMAEQMQADWVIVGACGMGTIERTLMGSVSQAVLRHCKKSVLIAKLAQPQETEEA